MRPEFPVLYPSSGHRARYCGREVRNFLSNNYLGLSNAREVVAAAVDATKSYGTSVAGSRLTCGNLDLHETLERELAEFFGVTEALVFTTGYTANLGAIGGLVEPNGIVLVDDHCHASIFDGIVLAMASPLRFRHGDVSHLEALASSNNEIAAIIVCGVYPVYGDVSDLGRIAKFADSRGVPLLVDEAHAFGVLGQCGRGAAEMYACRSLADVTTVTFSKALGSLGGAVVGKADFLDRIRRSSRSFRFAASAPPSAIAAAISALRIVRATPKRSERLRGRAQWLRDRLGGRAVRSPSAIVAIPFSSDGETNDCWEALLRRGVLCALHGSSVSPDGRPLLRFAITTEHDYDDLEAVASSLSSRSGFCQD